jgi:hypothetical protein
MSTAENLAGKIFIATLWVLPFYLPIVVWAASNFGSIYVFSAWKELVMIGLLALLAKQIIRLMQTKDNILRLLNLTTTAYIALALLYVIKADSLFEYAAGFLFSTRLLLFFLIAQALAQLIKKLPERIRKIILVSGGVLAGIAILQALVLPPTFLQHFGYEPLGVETPGFPPSVTTLGEVDDFIRPQATLRGPNPLGAFLVLPFCLLVLKVVQDKRRDAKTVLGFLLIGLAMLFTFSRSAWLAALIGTAGILLYTFRDKLRSLSKAWFIAGAVLIIGFCIFTLNNKTMRVIILREENSSSVRLSDDIRSSLTKEAWEDVISNPLGRGLGNAGPVSVLDSNDRGRIAENYFLQTAQETGWLGLVLFIAIQLLLLVKLWSLRANGLALVAFVTLCGLTVANLTLHTWADETVSIMWWSFAGAIIGSSLKQKKVR